MANRTQLEPYEVDPISRIEGHLGVKVTTDGWRRSSPTPTLTATCGVASRTSCSAATPTTRSRSCSASAASARFRTA